MSINPIHKIIFNKITGTYYVYRSGRPVQLRKDVTRAMKEFFTIATISDNNPNNCTWVYRG